MGSGDFGGWEERVMEMESKICFLHKLGCGVFGVQFHFILEC